MSVASFKSRGLLGMFVVAAVMLCMASPSFGQAAPGQPGQPGQQGQRGGRTRGQNGQNGQQQDPQQRRQQFQEQMREAMGATPDEWALLQPKIEKIQQLQRAASSGRGGMGLLFGNRNNTTDPNATPGGGNRGNRGNRGQGGNGATGNDPPSPVATKSQELQTTLQNKDTPPEELKQKLAELRQARIKAKADVGKAQEELREIVTVRQESVLVTLGILE